MKIATAFSGIGAIEYALKRMNKEHEIVFACDNGNIEIDIDYNKEFKKIKKMDNPIQKRDYTENLYKTNSRKTNFVEKTYKNNYNIKENMFFYDVKLLDGTDFKNKIDLFVGGSPCQSFSIIGERLGLEDTRGTLFYEYVRLVNEIQPEVFIYENVYGILTHDKGKTWNIMQKIFQKLGYHFKYKILDSKNYGIPQARRRLFVVGFKDINFYNKFEFPKEQELNYTMQDFLLTNTKLGNFKSIDSKISLIKEKGEIEDRYYLSEKLKNYVLSPGTKNFMHKDAKIDLQIARAILSTQGNTHRASVNNYVTTNGKIRALSPRESLRLMGFDDDFKQTVSVAQSYKQSGNSIVVDVLINLLKEIYNTGVFNE